MNILITGATSGIGQQLALQYLAQGHQVICCGRNLPSLQVLSERYPTQVITRCFDITDYQQAQTQLSALPALDLVILNAGTCEYISPAYFDAQAFARVVNTNVLGIANCLEALLSQIKKGGRLALVGSSVGYLPLPRAEAYGASKAAIEYLSKTLAITLQPLAIAVTYIAPGFVKTPLTDQNDFPMPMLMDVEKAARIIIAGLVKGKAEIHFPRRFTYLLKFIGMLPNLIQKQLISRLVARL